MHSVCCCCIPIWRRSPLEKEPLVDLFLANCLPPPLDPPLGGVCRKAYKQVRDYEYFISIKFCKHPSSGSVRKAEEEVLWRRNPSLTYFWQIAPPPLDPPLGGVCRKAYKQVRDYEYFISIKFRKHPSSGFVGKADYVFQNSVIYMH